MNAHEFYQDTKATEIAVQQYHKAKFEEYKKQGKGLLDKDSQKYLEALLYRTKQGDDGTKALSKMLLSKTAEIKMPEPMLVIEPGGRELYKRPIHEKFSKTQLKAPDEWKKYVFEQVLSQELKGGEFVYDSTRLVPLAVFED